ncbi:MAG TPA: hypothetical protein VGF67_13290 [Ktedonobacteraceae bacterium]
MEQKHLVALDTRHIKRYVFATDKLKEIRGASATLDLLNRHVMEDVARELGIHVRKVFANGGAALFLIDGDEQTAQQFGRRIQQRYHKETFAGVSITFAVQKIPEHVANAWEENIQETLDLLYARLEMESNHEEDIIELSSHPFMHTCDSCGVRYAETRDKNEARDAGSLDRLHCCTCQQKRSEDEIVKKGIGTITAFTTRYAKEETDSSHEMTLPDTEEIRHSFAWQALLRELPSLGYEIPANTERPSDFNELRSIVGGKGYFAVIYADGNGMGTVMNNLHSLKGRKEKADLIDTAVYNALRAAVSQYLPVDQRSSPPLFPFDLLLVGGDDILIVTSADVALDIALTIAKQFHEQTGKQHTLSVGVVLAPVKYPFGLLHNLAEETLKYAKKEGAKKIERSTQVEKGADTDARINFLVVTGSTSQSFEKVYDSLCDKHGRVSGREKDIAFYATLRPYAVEMMDKLLQTIRAGQELGLGRTKLHQIREAVLKMNLTSSVKEGLELLHNWRPRQRDFISIQVYEMGNRYQKRYRNEARPETLFPRTVFPWFADGSDAYRSPLLDFVELYDFVASKGGNHADKG